MTGFIGTASINQALSKYGYHDVAYRLLQQEHYPSWLYPVINGATTIWERLNSYTIENGFGGNNAMNSFNHYSFGAVTAWMYETILGIKPEEENPAFKSFVLQPVPDPSGQMLWAKGYFNTVYGQIVSAWQWQDEEKKLCEFIVKIPSNTEAKIRFPLGVSVEEFYDNKFEPVKDWQVSSDESWQDWQESTYGSGIYKFKVQY
jgi:alpha-L-rhamnosidase